MKYEKRPIIDEDKVESFFMSTDSGGHARFYVYEGVIIFVSERTSPYGECAFGSPFHTRHDLFNCNPNWEEVAKTLIKCRQNADYNELRGMLDKNSEEYKALKSAMEKCIAERISEHEKEIRKWESLLEKW